MSILLPLHLRFLYLRALLSLHAPCSASASAASCWYIARTDIPHRLHTSQAIEQPVQALALPRLVSRRLSDQGLAHQAYDEAVALVEAHALFQLVRNGAKS